jgi:hypothetical protein
VPAERSHRGGRRPGRVAGLAVVALLLGLVAWSATALQPPDPAPADAPATDFSATRAFRHVEDIAADIHITGSDANERVVDQLVATLTGLGLDTRVQTAVGARQTRSGETRMARVRNVVGFLPGSDPTGRLFLMAHHDSVETGPGAADDAAGVAALLESVRALTEGPQLRNDLVVVLTDAEEPCLCGAEAFAAAHPLANEGGVVLNFEARGTTGPPIMFETSEGNEGVVGAFAAVPHPVGSSFGVEVYRTLPNDTDFSALLADGDFTGMNTAFIDGVAAYHTPQDVPARLDRGTLQALGDNALALARELGGRDLAPLAEPGAQDATYFPVLGELVRYPGRLVWPLALASVAAVGLLGLVVRRRGFSSLRRTAAATALTAIPLVAAPMAAQGLWALLVAVRPGYASMIDPWQPGPYRLAVVTLVAAVVVLWYALLRRRIGTTALSVGALLWLAVLAVVLAQYAPGGSYLAVWPALVGAVVGIVAMLTSSGVVRLGAALLAGAAAVVVLAPTVVLFFPALGLQTGAAPAAVATLLAVALLPAVEFLFPDPHAEWVRGGWLQSAVVPGAAIVLAAALTVAGLTVDRFDADHPVPSQLAYVLDTDRDEAWWASTEDAPIAYTAGYVDDTGRLPGDHPYLVGRDVALGTAENADLTPPTVTIVDDRVVGERREITVRVTPQRPGVRMVALDLTVDGGTVAGARVSGRGIPEQALGKDRLWLVFHAPPADGLKARFSIEGDGAVSLRVVDGSVGLDGLPGFTPRPEGVDVAGSHTADLVSVSGTTDLGRRSG